MGVVIVVAITAATAYFVAQEFAYLAVDRSRLQAAVARGDRQAERTLAITRRTSFLLSGAQLGITVTGLLVGYVAEPLIGEALADLLKGSVGWSTGLALLIGSVVALALSTFVQMLLGELFPKNYAIARAEPVARWLSGSTRVYLTVFGPLIWIFDRAAEGFLRLLRIEPVHDVEHSATAHDLEAVVEESRESGDLPQELSVVLSRILDFPNHDVSHAMVPRGRVDHLPDTATIGQVRSAMAQGHTRYPVLADDGQIRGVVHLLDVLPRSDLETLVTEVVRPPLVVHELMDLPDALDALLAADEELACVVDEYGDFAGILTIEDLAEEVVGDITDEHDGDEPDPDSSVVADGPGWLAPGDAHVDEVGRILGVDLPPGPYQTVSGMVVDLNKTLPMVGDVVAIELPLDPDDLIDTNDPPRRMLLAEVLEIDRHVPSRLRLGLAADGEGGQRGDAPGPRAAVTPEDAP